MLLTEHCQSVVLFVLELKSEAGALRSLGGLGGGQWEAERAAFGPFLVLIPVKMGPDIVVLSAN